MNKKGFDLISKKSNVSAATPRGWFLGVTRRPQSATIEAVGRAFGWKRRWVPNKR